MFPLRTGRLGMRMPIEDEVIVNACERRIRNGRYREDITRHTGM